MVKFLDEKKDVSEKENVEAVKDMTITKSISIFDKLDKYEISN